MLSLSLSLVLHRQISDKNHEIENLQRSLEDKKVKANLLAKQHQSILETSDLTIQKIQQNVNEVSVQLKKLIRENRQAEKTLHEVRWAKSTGLNRFLPFNRFFSSYFANTCKSTLHCTWLSVFCDSHRKTVRWRETLKLCSKTLMTKSKKSR